MPRTLAIAVATALAGGFVAGSFAPAPPTSADEPRNETYEGQSAAWWVERWLSSESPPGARGKALTALKALGPATFPDLVRAFEGTDEERRSRAVAALREIPGEPADLLRRLRGALYDTAPEVRAATLRKLAYLGRKAVSLAPDVVALAKDADAAVRFEAARRLGDEELGARGATEALVALFDDPNEDVRAEAYRGISRLGPVAESAAPALLAHLPTVPPYVRRTVLVALGRTGSTRPEVLDALRAALADPDPPKRWGALEAYAMCAGPDAAARYAVAALSEPLPYLKETAVRILGRATGSADVAVPALVRALDDTSREVRNEAARALVPFGAAAADGVPALVAVLRRDGETVAMDVLVQVPERSLPLLVDAYPSLPVSARIAVAASLRRIDRARRDPFVPRLTEALLRDLGDASIGRELRWEVTNALWELAAEGPPAALALASAAASPDAFLAKEAKATLGAAARRGTAVSGLVARGDSPTRLLFLEALELPVRDGEEWVAPILACLSDPDARVRTLAAADLLYVRDHLPWKPKADGVPIPRDPRPYLDALLAGMRDARPDTRRRAADLLATMGLDAADAMPVLLETLVDADRPAVRAAAKAYAEIARKTKRSVLEAVRAMLEGADAYARCGAAIALAEAGGYREIVVPVLLPALANPDARVRVAACEAAARLELRGAPLAPAIEPLVREADPAVSQAASAALVAVGGVVGKPARVGSGGGR